MSTIWGPAMEAEVGYRQQMVRFHFRRNHHRRAARSTPRNASRGAAARQASAPLVARAA